MEEGTVVTGIKEASLKSCRLEKWAEKSNATIALIFFCSEASLEYLTASNRKGFSISSCSEA